jgi:hypothetical protein
LANRKLTKRKSLQFTFDPLPDGLAGDWFCSADMGNSRPAAQVSKEEMQWLIQISPWSPAR